MDVITAAEADGPRTEGQLDLMQGCWRAANYLSVGQIYLQDNPLLRETLSSAHIRPRLLGHFGTTPGLNFIYPHRNRVIKDGGLDIMFIAGPVRS